jgi:hypothetical protein
MSITNDDNGPPTSRSSQLLGTPNDRFAREKWGIFHVGVYRLIGRTSCPPEPSAPPGSLITLDLAFEYQVQTRQTGPADFSRQPIILPFDLTTRAVPMQIVPSLVCWIDGMSKTDRELYDGLIKQAVSMMEAAETKARAAQSGLVLPGSP